MLDPHKLAHDCIMDAPAPCSNACPIAVDVRDMIERLKIGSFSAAYKTFAKSAIFPGIVSHICPQSCEKHCPRSEIDQAVKLLDIEKFLWRESLKTPAKSMFIPDKKKKILTVGAGLSGMSIALKLAQRGYHITLAEKTDRAGGALWSLEQEKILSAELIENAVDILKSHKYIDLMLNTEIIELSEEYDAVLLCAGRSEPHFDLDGRHNVFFLGAANEPEIDFMSCIREANEMFHVVENYVKIGRKEPPKSAPKSMTFRPNIANEKVRHSAISSDGGYISADEANCEAERCLLCTCSNCVDSCEMLKHYKKSPKKTIMDLSDTINKTPLIKKNALRQVMSCTQCGLCSDVCPVGIDFKSVCLESREILHNLGHLPDALYEYWLNDMEFSNDEAYLLLSPENKSNTKYLLFTGCQIGASDPKYVTKSYDWLKNNMGDDNTSLMLGCCGAPAYWAGNREMHKKVISSIKTVWEELNKPLFIMPCPTCVEMFSLHLEEISTISLWEFMADKIDDKPKGSKATVSVFDPCSSKYSPSMQDAVRTIVQKSGYNIDELNSSQEKSSCCGHGGLIYTTNPSLDEKIRTDSISASENPYLTYCINCRDRFASESKDALYIMDALFFDDEERFRRSPPNLSERRKNRYLLKNMLIKGNTAMKQDTDVLEISDNLRKILDRRLILDDNILKVIRNAEQSGKKLINCETGCFTAHALEGNVTFWVEYEIFANDRFKIHNAYAHRMIIEE